jgi:hypothetical protein
MARTDFIEQLQALGYTVQEPAQPLHAYVVFEYEIPVGRLRGQKVWLGLLPMDSFPMDAPTGPHFSPHLLPVTGGGGTHPTGGVHPSPLGAEWQYWSRPFKEWNRTDKTVKTYLSHIKNLLATI